jgi:hypothetical protein
MERLVRVMLVWACFCTLCPTVTTATGLLAGEVVMVTHFNHGRGCLPEVLVLSTPSDGCFDDQTGLPAVSCRRDTTHCASTQMVVNHLHSHTDNNTCTFYTFTWVCSDLKRTPCGISNACEPLATCTNTTLGLCTCVGNLTLVATICVCVSEFYIAHITENNVACLPITPRCELGTTEKAPPTTTSDRLCRKHRHRGAGPVLYLLLMLMVVLSFVAWFGGPYFYFKMISKSSTEIISESSTEIISESSTV